MSHQTALRVEHNCSVEETVWTMIASTTVASVWNMKKKKFSHTDLCFFVIHWSTQVLTHEKNVQSHWSTKVLNYEKSSFTLIFLFLWSTDQQKFWIMRKRFSHTDEQKFWSMKKGSVTLIDKSFETKSFETWKKVHSLFFLCDPPLTREPKAATT